MAEQVSGRAKKPRQPRRRAGGSDGPGDGDAEAGSGPAPQGVPGATSGREVTVSREVALLSATEALQRLELLTDVSGALDTSLDDYQGAAAEVAKVCVPVFADLCAIELVGLSGETRNVAFSVAEGSGMEAPADWQAVGLAGAASTGPVLAFEGQDGSEAVAYARRSLRAESLIVAPIAEGGITLGCFVAATGPTRRAFRPSALRIGVEIASRMAAAIQQATLQLEMQAVSKEQARSMRRLRRLAAAASTLAGAGTMKEVLHVACLEACFIQEADGAIARWWMPDGTVVEARAGRVDGEMAERAFEATAGRRFVRDRAWVAYPLLPNQVHRRAALVIFVNRELTYDEELVLASLASLIPVAFERAVGTGAALAQEARVRAVVSASPVALVGLGATGLVTLANPAAQLLFGWEKGPATAVLPPCLEPPFMELAETVRRSGSVANRVVSAGPFELSLSAAPMPAISGGGDELSVLVAATDLGEVKRAERALVQAQRLQAMGLVAGRVAHDFNNLLTVIIGYAELLGRIPGEEAQQLAVANINRAARRATSLTQQLLGLAGGQHDAATAVDLATELRELATVVGRLANSAVTVRAAYPEAPVIVALSPSGAQQVVLNLAINACHAMDQGGALDIELVTVRAQDGAGHRAHGRAHGRADGRPSGADEGEAAGWAILTISDNGVGMTEEERAHCLEPFFTTKPRDQGTGLGLPTVHALVSEAGGHMEIESAPGVGTRVTVRLPLSEHLPLAGESEPSETWPTGRVLSGRALLVEDDEALRELAARGLREAGLLVTSIGSAEAVAAAARSEGPFDVLVTDVMLPGRSGLDLARDLGAGVAGLPVLFVTAYSEGAGPLPGPGPYVQVLQKPYRLVELVFAVAALLGGRAEDGGGPA